ncbi:potassium transporter [Desulfosoma caldarium]|uniref:RCK N-terminal domain-containing protein n=1 Tax=Desulfosoma caldarium TaxID=610254 RepID=A0A3N1VJR3_9BACT|nr:potassium transporter [Desulfosoma caldarium]ROR03054.1 hypothetical protein EDC27_0309 [Desulfosoma caldarium]
MAHWNLKQVWPAEEPFPESVRGGAQLWILGAGRFGRLAMERLLKGDINQAVVVDADRQRLMDIPEESPVIRVRGDIFVFLSNQDLVDHQWIIPAVPVHVAYGWILMELSKKGVARRLAVPTVVDAQVPHPIRTPSGTVYASHATFRCPDDCPEPEDHCTITKKPRPEKLYQTLQNLSIPTFGTVVIQSRQLAPGVGGYTGAQLKEALGAIEASPGAYCVATSCSCHAVIDALLWEGSA